jgi:hypothetical protein
MIIPEWEAEYWQTILDDAIDKNDEELQELALKHLYPVYPEVEDTALLDIEDDEILSL